MTEETRTQYEANLDHIMDQYLESQITCMILHHVGSEIFNNKDRENGEIIIEAVDRMRLSLAKQRNNLIEKFSKEDIDASCARIKFDQKLYLSLSDKVFADNDTFFHSNPRPEEGEFMCDSALCDELIQSISQEYFPTLIAA